MVVYKVNQSNFQSLILRWKTEQTTTLIQSKSLGFKDDALSDMLDSQVRDRC